MVDDVKQFCADDPADDDPEKQVGDVVCLQANAGTPECGCPHAQAQASGHENAVPMDGEATYFKCDWIHGFTKLMVVRGVRKSIWIAVAAVLG